MEKLEFIVGSDYKVQEAADGYEVEKKGNEAWARHAKFGTVDCKIKLKETNDNNKYYDVTLGKNGILLKYTKETWIDGYFDCVDEYVEVFYRLDNKTYFCMLDYDILKSIKGYVNDSELEEYVSMNEIAYAIHSNNKERLERCLILLKHCLVSEYNMQEIKYLI